MLEAYERHPDAFTSTVDERASLPLSWWQDRLQDAPVAGDIVLGAFQGTRMLGVAGLTFETRAKARHKAHLFGMYVTSSFRKGGLGRQLVMAALEHARTRADVRLVQLTVTQGNTTAQGLYERCGFVPFGVEPYAILAGETYVSKVHMWCDLGVAR